MAKFHQTVSVSYDIVVEAEDMYDADDIISRMSYKEIQLASVSDPYVSDTNEFPEEW